jgi:hypothetical protein
MTAVQLVSNFNGFGVHTFFTIIRQFPDFYKNFIFVSVVVIDQGLFKGEENLETHKIMVEESLKKYVALARKFGFPAEYRLETGTDMVKTGTELCLRVTQEYPRSTVFTGKLAFKIEKLYHKVLHNEAAFAIQRNLHWSGVTNIILPIRMEG